jgi:hypothetical protein
MRTRASISSLRASCLAVVRLTIVCVAVVGGGCRSREHPSGTAPAPDAVGFELPGNASVARGALLTRPPGHEEAFVPFVAVGAPGWIDACRREPGVTAPLFSFETDARGALRMPASDSGATARDRCLAARAASGGLSGLPPGIHVTVQLALRAP